MTSKRGKKIYKLRLPKEVLSLLEGRHLAGITEMNTSWFKYLSTLPEFSQGGRYKGLHDGHDVAIFWDSWAIEPTDPSPEPQQVYKSFHDGETYPPGREVPSDIPVSSNKAAFDWRQFMVVEFRLVASPHIVFIAACTHGISGSIETGPRITHISGTKKTPENKRSLIAMRALEKALKYAYLPSAAAGNNKTCLVFMGDWNTHKDRMRKDVSLAVTTARAHAVTPLVMTAPGTEQRDHAVCFCENRWWSAKVESIPAATYEALKDCYGKEHFPLFFSLTAMFIPPATELPSPRHAPMPFKPPHTASTREGVFDEVKHFEEEVWKARQPDVQSTPVPAPPLLFICVLNLLSQVRRGQTQTFLVEGSSREYFSVCRFAPNNSFVSYAWGPLVSLVRCSAHSNSCQNSTHPTNDINANHAMILKS